MNSETNFDVDDASRVGEGLSRRRLLGSTAAGLGSVYGISHVASAKAADHSDLPFFSEATGGTWGGKKTGGWIQSSPTVVNGIVVFGSFDGTVYAIDAETGDEIWTVDTQAKVYSSPTIADGTVYIGALDGTLYAIDFGTGDIEWQYLTNAGISSSPAVEDGTLYVGSLDTNVYAFDAASGTVNWTFPTKGGVESSPNVANGTVYVGSKDGSFYALDATSGEEVWTLDTAARIYSSPTVVDGTVYFGSHDNRLYACRTSDGLLEWSFQANGPIGSSPTVVDGSVFVGSDDNNVYAVDAATGTETWRFPTANSVVASPTVGENHVLIGSTSGRLYAIDPETGNGVWRTDEEFTNYSIVSSPTIADGRIFYGMSEVLIVLAQDPYRPFNASSDGSRVHQEILGYNESTGTEDEPDEDFEVVSFSHSPQVPETGEDITFEVEIEDGASDLDVELSYQVADGGYRDIDMTPSGGTWSTTIVPDVEMGDKIEYDIAVLGEEKNKILEGEPFHVFEVVESVGVFFVEFANSAPGRIWPIDPRRTGSDLKEYQKKIARRTNEFMASWKGPWGAVGYNFEFYDNDGDWYSLDYAHTEYNTHDKGEGSNVADFREDALIVIPKIVEEFDYNPDDPLKPIDEEFHSPIVVSPGDARASTPVNTYPGYHDGYCDDEFAGGLAERGDNRIHINEEASNVATWIHELGHALGLRDLYEYDDKEQYTHGEIDYSGMMGSGSQLDPSAPFSVASRTKYHRLLLDDAHEDTGREEWPWASLDTEEGQNTTINVNSLESMEHGDSIPEYVPGPTDNTRYLLGARGSTIETDDETCDDIVQQLEKGIYMYRVTENQNSANEIDFVRYTNLDFSWQRRLEPFIYNEPIGSPTFYSEGDNVSVISPTSEEFFEMSLLSEEGDEESYTATLEVTEPDVSVFHVVAIVDENPPFLAYILDNLDQANSTDIRKPGIRLHAYDSHGNHIGINYETGEFENEIPGVDDRYLSGPTKAFKWIAVPKDRDIRFEIDSRGIQEWLDWKADTIGFDLGSVDPEALESEVTLHADTYGKNPHYDDEAGEVKDVTTISRDVNLSPGERSTAAVSATVSIHSETINKASKGKWVKAEIQIPDADTEVSNVDLSTVTLNGDVPAIEEGYGFTKQPVEGDTLQVRFDRRAVASTLEMGEGVTITVAGAAGDTLFTGDDTVRVLADDKSQQGKDNRGPRGGGRGGKGGRGHEPGKNRNRGKSP